jgi:hypothetical protein
MVSPIKISQLRSEFVEKTQARDEQLSMIKAIRSRISSELEITTSQQDRTVKSEEQGLDEVILKSSNFSEQELPGVEEENVDAYNDSEVFCHSNQEAGEDYETVARLQSEIEDVSNRLKNEMLEKNEQKRKMDWKVSELSESSEKLKDKIQILEVELSNQKVKNEKIVDQLKSSNRVLQAELVCQREYVENLRSASLADLASKLREEVETIAVQEIAKSNIGTEVALKECEERWKRRFEEMQLEHEKEKTLLHEKYQNEMRYNKSQCQIQVEQTRVEVEDRLQQRFTESLKAAIAHKEAQRQLDLKNEMKRWTQVSFSLN